MTGTPRYLLVVFLAHRQGYETVPPGHVATTLEISPSTATETLQRLAADGLLEYEPYDGVRLSEEGRGAASTLFERYRILTRFFRDVLAVPDPEGEAMKIAGCVSDAVTGRLAATVLADDAAIESPDRTRIGQERPTTSRRSPRNESGSSSGL